MYLVFTIVHYNYIKKVIILYIIMKNFNQALLFVSHQVFFLFVNQFNIASKYCVSRKKYCLFYLKMVKMLKKSNYTLKYYSKLDNVASYLPPHKIILFELNFNLKFPLVCLLYFRSDLKSNIYCIIRMLIPSFT